MIKARPCAGDAKAGEALVAEIAPFVWRKHLDFAALADVHDMKRQMQTFRGQSEIAVEGHNVKVGRGGIREIEFFAQTQQLIAGGRHPELRVRPTLEALERAGVEQLDHLRGARRTDRGLPVPAAGRASAADDRGRADPYAARRCRGGGALRAFLRLRRAARPSPRTCSAISTSCRGITASCSRAIRPAPRNCRRWITAPVRTIRGCSNIWRRSASRSRSMVAKTVQQWMAGDYRVFRVEATRSAFRRIRAGADRRPGACRGARQCGDGVRPLPAGVAARRAADLAAQPEPRPRRAGGADSRRRAAARRHAGAAAADHGRADRSALLRRDAGPARIVRAARGDAGGCGFLRGVSRPVAAVRPGKPVPDRHAHPVRHGLGAAGQRRLRRRRRGHRPYRAWPGDRSVRGPARPHQGAGDRDPGDGQARQPRDDGVVRSRSDPAL